MRRTLPCLFLALSLPAAGVASAKSVSYTIDPNHTYPGFAADHMGISKWRGKFDHTTGTITLDREARTGSVHIVTEVSSINFGLAALDKQMMEPSFSGPMCKEHCNFFDAAKYPQAVYDGKLTNFVNGKPTRVVGKLTLHGETRPLGLRIDSFKCIPDMLQKTSERCGAEASTTFDRSKFGIDAGQSFGFDMNVSLQIQVEAVQDP